MSIITETVGSIFSAPPDSILIHACNAKGVWGSRVALDFKQRYPQAFKTYTTHCKTSPKGTSILTHQRSLAGTCLLIPPSSPTPKSANHHIACLITSVGYGKNVDDPDRIIQNTASALKELKIQIAGLRSKGWEGEVWAVRINSGRFGVEWRRTRAILEGWVLDVRVVVPETEGGEGEGGAGGVVKVIVGVVEAENDVIVQPEGGGEKYRDNRGGTGDDEGNGKRGNTIEYGGIGHGKKGRVMGNEVHIKGVDMTMKPEIRRGKRVRTEDGGAGDGDHVRVVAKPSKRR